MTKLKLTKWMNSKKTIPDIPEKCWICYSLGRFTVYLVTTSFPSVLHQEESMTKVSSTPIPINKKIETRLIAWKTLIIIFLTTNSRFIIPISLQSDGVHLWYFKLRLFDLTELIIWFIKVYDNIGLTKYRDWETNQFL